MAAGFSCQTGGRSVTCHHDLHIFPDFAASTHFKESDTPMPAFDQSTRLAQLFSPLPAGDIVLLDMHGSEFVNGDTVYFVRALTPKGIAEIEPLLGEPMSIKIDSVSQTPRDIHLLVDAIHYLGAQDQNHLYEFELRPWLWMLGRRVNSRIFKEKSVADIIREIAGEHGIGGQTALDIKATCANDPVEYLVQYNESDLDFLRRLMEQTGMNCHCEMTDSKHTIVLSDSTDSFPLAPGPGRSFSPLGEVGDRAVENFDNWMPRRKLTTGQTRLTDYNFKTPTANMEVNATAQQNFQFSNLESFVYPGNYLAEGGGKPLAKRRTEALRGGDAIVMADGNAPTLGAGMRFDLAAHPDDSQEDEYVVLAAHHSINNGDFSSSGGGGNDQGTHRGSFQLTRSSIPVAPALKTPRPTINSPQTAVVVDGANGELDEFGRITLQFPWAPDAETVRCRVSQIWAAEEWGTMFVPHTGMEVIVEFMNGDPDQPIVTGCLWNNDRKPDFPASKLISGFKTVRDNRLLFVDEEGSEAILIRGQKDMVTVVMNDDKHIVHNNRITKITTDQTDTVGGNVKTTVEGKEDHKVTGALTIESTSKIELKVGGSSIVIDTGSITISSPKITIDAQMALKTNGGATAEHGAGGKMTIQAPMVMIN